MKSKCSVKLTKKRYCNDLIDLPDFTRHEMFEAAKHILFVGINSSRGLNQILADFGENDEDMARLKKLYDLEYQDFVEIMAHRILQQMPEKCEEYLRRRYYQEVRGRV